MATALVVDDQLHMCLVLETTMRRGGHEVLIAANGPRALELARAHRPDVVLLDAELPGMHGFELCQRLKDDALTRDILVVLVTARARQADRERGMAAGADAYVAKPFSPRALLALLSELLGSRGA